MGIEVWGVESFEVLEVPVSLEVCGEPDLGEFDCVVEQHLVLVDL